MDDKQEGGDSEDGAAPVSQGPAAAPQVDLPADPSASSSQSQKSTTRGGARAPNPDVTPAAVAPAAVTPADATSALVWWTRVLAFAALVAIGVSIAQCSEMRSQLQEMRAAESGADAQLSAANRLASAAEKEYDIAKSAAAAATSTAKTASDSELRELRPYISVSTDAMLDSALPSVVINPVIIGAPMSGRVRATNTGRTPSVKAILNAGIVSVKDIRGFNPARAPRRIEAIQQEIPPGTPINIDIYGNKAVVSSNPYPVAIYGSIHYFDTFGHSYDTYFCFIESSGSISHCEHQEKNN